MTSLAKIRSNRRNSLKSTGPVSLAGKKQSSLNAVKHGLLSKLTVIRGETQEEWSLYRLEVIKDLAPVGLVEISYAERVALLFWRMRRLAELNVVHDELDGFPKSGFENTMQEMFAQVDLRFPPNNLQQKIKAKTVREMEPSIKEKRDIRYETHLNRTLTTTLNQLLILQDNRMRKG